MKAHFLQLFILLVVFTLLPTSSCKKEPLDNVKLIVNSDFIKTSYGLVFKDAATGEPVGMNGGPRVNVKVTGTDSDDVIDIAGPEGPDFKAVNGFLALGITPGITPSEANPVEFNMVITAEGYVSTSVPVYTIEEKREFIIVELVNFQNPPAGVEAVVDHSVNISAGGSVINDVEIATDPAGTGGGTAKLEIPQGLVMKNADGQILQGNLTTRLVYFSHLDNSALAVFPGGLVATVNENTTTGNVTFISAGFVAVEIEDNSGRQAKTFENGTVGLTIEISPQTPNPVTGNSVQDGDMIPLWSYDEETGIWAAEGTLSITGPNVRNMYESTVQLTHLSYWNWDWKGPGVCNTGASLCLRSSVFPNGTLVSGIIKSFNNVTGALMRQSTFYEQIGNCIQFARVPGGIPVRIVMEDFYGNLLGETIISNLCSGTYDIWLGGGGGGGPVLVSISVSVAGYCVNEPDVLIRPTLFFLYRNISQSGPWIPAWLINGQITVPDVSLGETYAAGLYYNETWVDYTLSITTSDSIVLEDLLFTEEVCDFLGI